MLRFASLMIDDNVVTADPIFPCLPHCCLHDDTDEWPTGLHCGVQDPGSTAAHSLR